MNTLVRLLLLTALLLAALICYGYGQTTGTGIFLALGLTLELLFWLKLLTGKRRGSQR